MGLDTDSICAALLHDCIEDTEFGYKEIENKFGTPVAELVDGVTRLGMLRYSKEQEQFEDLRKMFLAMAKGYPRYPHQAGRPTAQCPYLPVPS